MDNTTSKLSPSFQQKKRYAILINCLYVPIDTQFSFVAYSVLSLFYCMYHYFCISSFPFFSLARVFSMHSVYDLDINQ